MIIDFASCLIFLMLRFCAEHCFGCSLKNSICCRLFTLIHFTSFSFPRRLPPGPVGSATVRGFIFECLPSFLMLLCGWFQCNFITAATCTL